MTQITTENTFETALIQSLVEQGGYTHGDAEDRCPIFPGDTQKTHIGFDDPAHATEIMAQFTRVRDEIIVGILGFLKGQ